MVSLTPQERLSSSVSAMLSCQLRRLLDEHLIDTWSFDGSFHICALGCEVTVFVRDGYHSSDEVVV